MLKRLSLNFMYLHFVKLSLTRHYFFIKFESTCYIAVGDPDIQINRDPLSNARLASLLENNFDFPPASLRPLLLLPRFSLPFLFFAPASLLPCFSSPLLLFAPASLRPCFPSPLLPFAPASLRPCPTGLGFRLKLINPPLHYTLLNA